MSSLDLEALKALAIAACSGDVRLAGVGCWVRRGVTQHRWMQGDGFILSYYRVVPEWEDVEILCEDAAHADYIAAMAPSTAMALIAELERLREVVRPGRCSACGLDFEAVIHRPGRVR